MGILVLLVIFYTDFRGVWIPRWSITDHNEIFSCLDGKFNHIFLQVFAAGEAYYPSKYALSKMRSDEWLKNFLDEAHRRKIKVSAWINTFYSWGYATRTFNSNHPINRNEDWYVMDQFGRSILSYNINELRRIGVEGYYLSPAHPEVRLYIEKIIEELLMYDFDGIHLDYIRYPNSEFIYDASLRSKFMRKYYFDPRDFFTQTNNLQTKLSLWGYDDLKKRWHEFINEDFTVFIGDLSKKIKKIKPGIQISVAVKPNYLTARNKFYQEWVNWLNSGLIDYVCLMAYSKNIKGILNKTSKVVKEKDRVTIGLALYLLSPAEIKKQVNLVNKFPFSGVVFFSYKELKKNKRYLNSLK